MPGKNKKIQGFVRFSLLIIGILIVAVLTGIGAIFYRREKPLLTDIDFSGTYQEIQEMTEKEIKERIGQMIMLGFRGTEISEDSDIVKTLNELNIGGVILFDFDVPSKSFPRNILNPEQTKKLIADLQKSSPIPLFVAVDAEGGKINRLKPEYGFYEILSPQKLGEGRDYQASKEEALKLARQLKNLGFNMNFAPVVDLNINPQNPIIGALGRSFSPLAEEVFLHAKAFIEAHRENNIIAVAKHFPGHGSSLKDSHLGMVDVTESQKQEELIPYQELNDRGLLFVVMTAHIFNKKIDENRPATLSPVFLQNILRKEIGFEGVIISDDMQMGAIVQHYGTEEAIIKVINAGCDILIFSNNSPSGYDEGLAYKVYEIIYRAVEDGRISKERIFESSQRIYNLKRQFGII